MCGYGRRTRGGWVAGAEGGGKCGCWDDCMAKKEKEAGETYKMSVDKLDISKNLAICVQIIQIYGHIIILHNWYI